MTRGIKHDVERFASELSAQYLPFNWFNPKKKELEPALVQTNLQPIQLWSVVFPKEHKDAMLNSLFPDWDGKVCRQKKHEKFVGIIRKALGIKKVPTDYKKDKKIPFHIKNMDMVPIGIKDDYEQDGQEML